MAVRVTPATVNVETCRPGANVALPVFDVVAADPDVPVDPDAPVGADVTVGATDEVEVAPDEHAAANTPSVAIVAIERRRTLRIMSRGCRDVVASR
jgi:hypothetical protein